MKEVSIERIMIKFVLLQTEYVFDIIKDKLK